MNDFVIDELRRRQPSRQSTSEDDLAFLRALNAHLADFDGAAATDTAARLPVLWVVGLPRSGTTLAMQAVTTALKVGYVDNLAARFWLAPATGLRLSRILLGAQAGDASFRSDFGKTPGLTGPHEFAYFWQRHLALEHAPPVDPEAMRRQADWQGLSAALRAMGAALGVPLVHKGIAILYVMDEIQRRFPESVFLHVRRDPLDIACSLAAARLSYYGDASVWWSLYTPDYASLRDQPFDRQIARQVSYFLGLQSEAIQRTGDSRQTVANYVDICARPNEVVEAFRYKVREATGFAIETRAALPAGFAPSRPAVSDDIRETLKSALAAEGVVST